MRFRISFPFVFAVCLASQCAAQPTIKYMIPNTGIPGMPVVVEFIAPHSNSKNQFGPDGINSSHVRVKTGTSDIIPGPTIVADTGRVLDAVLFLTAHATQTSYFLSVEIDGQATGTLIEFRPHVPDHVGVLSGGGAIGSGAPFGNRSIRGAILVDSLILMSGNFTIDLRNKDNNNPGSTGYLPAIIYSLGPIRIATGATLTASAVGRDGGPGGGGGGGRACDYKTGYDNGGNGFSAGGGGGANLLTGFPPTPSKSWASPGTGTGTQGLSLNDAPPGDGGGNGATGCGTNGGAGGTGYPFGSGGTYWCTGVVPAGGIGGGSCASEGNGGGGGGHATKGNNGDAQNGGSTYGTPQVVPLCGGSGGAAGNQNPTLSTACGGEGGGGGGAIMLYSRDSIFIDGYLFANGADGSTPDASAGQNGGGGAGSGGAIVLQSNVGVTLRGIARAIGGTGSPNSGNGRSGGDGGDGRIRVDNPRSDFAGTVQPVVNYYGVSLDTLSSTRRSPITLSGSVFGAQAGTQVRLYVQRADGAYQQNGALDYYTPTITGNRYQLQVPLDFSGGNNSFFISAARVDGTTVTLSNAGAQILQFIQADCPTLQTDTLDFGVLTPCSGNVDRSLRDTINPKLDTLNLRLAIGKTNSLGQPIFSGFPAVLQGARYIQPITFDPRGEHGVNGGLVSDTLIVTDINNPQCSMRIVLRGRVYYDSLTAFPKTLTFTNTSLNVAASQVFNVTNSGTAPAYMTSIRWTPPDARLSLVTPLPGAFPVRIDTGAPTQVRVQFQAQNIGDTVPYNGFLKIADSLPGPNCIDSLLIPVSATVRVSVLANSSDPLDFGTVSSCTDDTLSLRIRNIGNGMATIDSVLLAPGSDTLAFMLLAGGGRDSIRAGDSIAYPIRFHPQSPDGPKRTMFYVYSNNALGIDSIAVIGRRATPGVSMVNILNFGSVNVGQSIVDTVFVVDTGLVRLCINSLRADPPFVAVAAVPRALDRGETLAVVITFAPGASDTATYNRTLRLMVDCPCIDTLLVALQARGVNGVPAYTALNFGTMASCARRVDSVKISNSGNTPITVDSFPRIAGPDAAMFTIVRVPPPGTQLNPGGFVYALVQCGGPGTDGPKTASLVMFTTANGRRDSSFIPLSALRVTRRAATTGPIVFPLLLSGTQLTRVAPVVNTGSAPIRITGVSIVPAAQFQAVAAVPALLNVGDTLPVQVTFSPGVSDTDSTRVISATLVVTTDDTCGSDSVRVALSGRGYNTRPVPVRLCFAQTQSAATLGAIVSIPIQIDTTVRIADTLTTTISIGYDPLVLHILGAQSVCGAASLADDPVRHVAVITVRSCTGAIVPGVFVTLQCQVLIGPRTVSTLTVDSIAFSSPTVSSIRCAQRLVFTAGQVCSGSLVTITGANALEQSRPNPVSAVNPAVEIEYELVADTRVTIRAWDVFGREIARIVDADVPHGRYVATFDTRGLPNGTYCYSIDAGIFHAARRLVILR